MQGSRFSGSIFDAPGHLLVLAVLATASLMGTALGESAKPPRAGAAPPSVVAGPSPKAAQCWLPEALQGRASDRQIRSFTRLALIDPPRGEPRRATPVPADQRGAIRRVDLPPGVKKIALTFDLCEEPYEVAGYDAEIVSYLRQEKVRATFFAGGKWFLTHTAAAQQLMADPLFEMGNHSWEHRNFQLLAGEALVDEIKWAQIAYERQLDALLARQCVGPNGAVVTKPAGGRSLTLFRFPFGACTKEALDAVADFGLMPIQWDVSSSDPSKSVSAEAMAREVVGRARPGSIVLFHANGRGWHTAEALKTIIPKLRDELGFELVTVSELIHTPGARLDRRPICFDSKPGDSDRYKALARKLEDRYGAFKAKIAREDAAKPPAGEGALSSRASEKDSHLPPPIPTPASKSDTTKQAKP